MIATHPGKAPELLYEPSFMNQALEAAGLDVVPPATLSGLARTWPTPDTAKTERVAQEFSERIAEMQLRATVATSLRDIRTRLRLSRKAVAEMVGVSQQTIANYERGHTLPPYRNC